VRRRLQLQQRGCRAVMKNPTRQFLYRNTEPPCHRKASLRELLSSASKPSAARVEVAEATWETASGVDHLKGPGRETLCSVDETTSLKEAGASA